MLLVASGYAQQNAPRFTGKSAAMEGKDLSVARRSFEAGARTYWHSHANGQLFMVEDGRMRTQKKGGPMRELGKGDSDYAGPNVSTGTVPRRGSLRFRSTSASVARPRGSMK